MRCPDLMWKERSWRITGPVWEGLWSFFFFGKFSKKKSYLWIASWKVFYTKITASRPCSRGLSNFGCFRFMLNVDVSLDAFQTARHDIENSLHHRSWSSPIGLHFKVVEESDPPQDHSAKFNNHIQRKPSVTSSNWRTVNQIRSQRSCENSPQDIDSRANPPI